MSLRAHLSRAEMIFSSTFSCNRATPTVPPQPPSVSAVHVALWPRARVSGHRGHHCASHSPRPPDSVLFACMSQRAASGGAFQLQNNFNFIANLQLIEVHFQHPCPLLHNKSIHKSFPLFHSNSLTSLTGCTCEEINLKSTAVGDGLIKTSRTSTSSSALGSGDGDDEGAVPVTRRPRHRRFGRDDP